MTWYGILTLAAVTCCASAQSPPPRAVASVKIYNLARLQPGDLSSAISVADSIFRGSGVIINWSLGSESDSEAHSLDFRACSRTSPRAPVGVEVIRLRIIGDAPPAFQPAALGFALPCAHYGANATVFADRVSAVSRHISVPLPAALGSAMAHELGHLLLHSGEHTPDGIMRARWDSRDWSLVSSSGLRFNAQQSNALRAAR